MGGAVSADMWGQAVAPAAREIVDERDVPEAIPALPIHSVRLEGVASIRCEENDATAVNATGPIRGQTHPAHFHKAPPIIAYVFQDLMRQHKIERAVPERQTFTGPAYD